MTAPLSWQDNGLASAHIDKHSYDAVTQASELFLQHSESVQRWSGKAQWRILETRFGPGLNFLVTWAAWMADPQRAHLLHFVSIDDSPVTAAALLQSVHAQPRLLPFAEQLAAQFHGLLPGVHRLSFADGRVLLTLAIGNTKVMLRELDINANAIYLNDADAKSDTENWDNHTLASLARHCHRGTRIVVRNAISSVSALLPRSGFVVQQHEDLPRQQPLLSGEYNPSWTLRRERNATPLPEAQPSKAVIIGAGLAAAAVAHALALRGWSVNVLDHANPGEGGASSLPVGLFAPHVSPDDAPLSQATRAGIRMLVQFASQHLQAGHDWALTGVLEQRDSDATGLPTAWVNNAAALSQYASAGQQAAAYLSGEISGEIDRKHLWHQQAGWVKPKALIRALLNHPLIEVCTTNTVRTMRRADEQWQLLDAQANVLSTSSLVVFCAGIGTQKLIKTPRSLQAVRGQVLWGAHPADTAGQVRIPINGWGHFLPSVPGEHGSHWLSGATFDRDDDNGEIRPEDRQLLLDQLRSRLPQVASALGKQLHTAKDWASVRATTPNHFPIVGPAAPDLPGVWVSTGLGARGLSMTMLCAAILAAKLHDEPLPISTKLASQF